jgi:hypothetical protein
MGDRSKVDESLRTHRTIETPLFNHMLHLVRFREFMCSIGDTKLSGLSLRLSAPDHIPISVVFAFIFWTLWSCESPALHRPVTNRASSRDSTRQLHYAIRGDVRPLAAD